MDFLNRNNGQNGQPGQPNRAATQAPHGPAMSEMTNNHGGGMPPQPHHNQGNHDHEQRHSYWSRVPGWLRFANVILLFSVTVLALAIAVLLRNSNPNEGQYVLDDKYQAVFLNNGQVYFGKVTSSTSRYYNLQNVFYLSSNSSSSDSKSTTSTSSNNFTLVKLGCELHGPYDQMIINRDQVTFWENLKDSSTVVKTIKEWVKQNPSGQQCSTTTGSSSQSSDTSSAAQNATGSTSTTGSTSSSSTGSTSTGSTSTSR
ncbi:MAG TPA: hypothetical protein VJ843_04975 [Candidatus Saccharimonadales bacterium]|nr:hypothetical protein [Candidatus Saccharimonadales bacterium]